MAPLTELLQRRSEEDTGITVIIPTFRRPDRLRAAITSVVAEDKQVSQVIVIDDGGGVDLPPMPLRCRLLIRRHRGVSAARNCGVRAARTKYVYFLDDDDVLLPGAISTLRSEASSHPSVDVVHARWQTINVFSTVLREPRTGPESAQLDRLALATLAPLSACLFRRSTFQRIGGFDESLSALEDWDLFLRLAIGGARFHFVDSVVAKYLDHPGSLSKQWLLVIESSERLIHANLRRLGIEDPLAMKRLHDFVVLETARRAVRAGCADEAWCLVARMLPDALVTLPRFVTAPSILQAELSAAASRLREEARWIISSYL